MKREKLMADLEKKIRKCKKCRLWISKKNYVIGEGNPSAKIIFVGEAPGAAEDERGKPFCGRSGKVLDEILVEIGMKRNEVFITNTVKCRPPNNRDPKKKEKDACSPYLLEQIKIIKPKVIAALGRHAMEYFFELFSLEKRPISECHGKVYEIQSSVFKGMFVVLYHPAVSVYNKNMKNEIIRDFSILKDAMKEKL